MSGCLGKESHRLSPIGEIRIIQNDCRCQEGKFSAARFNPGVRRQTLEGRAQLGATQEDGREGKRGEEKAFEEFRNQQGGLARRMVESRVGRERIWRKGFVEAVCLVHNSRVLWLHAGMHSLAELCVHICIYILHNLHRGKAPL